MLRRIFRLNRGDLKLFFKKGGFYRKGKRVTLRICINRLKTPRFAFVVLGPPRSAAQRNLVRRRMSEIVKLKFPKLLKGADMVFFLKLGKDKKVPPYKEIEEDILNVCAQINL